jgi:hypothetical protein
MNTITHPSVSIQTSAESVPAVPAWFGEVAVFAHYLGHVGVQATIEERVRFARRRFGHYDVIDFVVVLLGYAISSERTLEAFYESLYPFAASFMALFGRARLPHRSTLSRFLAALNQTAVEALRTVFLEDLIARPLEKEEKPGGLWGRTFPSIGSSSGPVERLAASLSSAGASETPTSPARRCRTR